jgi:ribosomal protein S21
MSIPADSHHHFVDNRDGNTLDAALRAFLRRVNELARLP